jgi:hypothetical protein
MRLPMAFGDMKSLPMAAVASEKRFETCTRNMQTEVKTLTLVTPTTLTHSNTVQQYDMLASRGLPLQ